MARTSGRGAYIAWAGQDLSGEANSWTLTIENDTHEVTAFGDSAKEYVEGDYGWSIEVDAYFEQSDSAWDDIIFDDIGGGEQAATIAPEGTAAPGVVYQGNAIIESHVLETPVDGAVTLSFTLRGNGALTRTTS